jgi:hypothetical protein
MAIVRSLEGTFYDIPDSELERYKVPPDQVKTLMDAAGQKIPMNPGPPRQGQGQVQVQTGGPGGSPQILVQFIMQGPGGAQQQGQPAPEQGEQESVNPQWYWINWANWANWYNWY